MRANPPSAGLSALFLAAALFYAPLAYGCTRPEMLPALFALLGAAIFFGVVGWLVDGRRPRVPGLVWLCVAALLAQGWWMVGDPAIQPNGVVDPAAAAYTVQLVHHLSLHAMVATTCLLGAFVVMCDLMTFPLWRRFLILAVACSGVVVSVIGDFLKLTGTTFMQYIWEPREIYWNDFALYSYHGTAGAFLILVWPVILVFARRGWSREVTQSRTIFWTAAAGVCGAALLLNASKAALVIGLLILPCPFLSVLLRMRPAKLAVLSIGATFLLGAGLLVTARLSDNGAFTRLTNGTEVSASFNGRMAAYGEYWDALPDAGWFGFGPGLFEVAFPYQQSPLENENIGLRENAYEDYFQTVLEWGAVGGVWWFLLVAGGIFRGVISYRQRDYFGSKTERHLVLAALLGAGGTLLQALVDFPLQVVSIRLFFCVLMAYCWAAPSMLSADAAADGED